MPPEPEPYNLQDRFGFVTDEMALGIGRFISLLKAWQAVHNLVSSAGLDEVWGRHVADSLQLVPLAPSFRTWVDLGSGAGFPGLIVAIAWRGSAERRFTFVEANGKKAAFLRAAIRETGVNASVAAERIEAHGPKHAGEADIISARALAPLTELCGLAAPYFHPKTLMLLLKGQDFAHEIETASKCWGFDVVDSQSATDPGGRVLAIRNLGRRVQRT